MVIRLGLPLTFMLAVSLPALPALGQQDDAPALRSAGRKLALDGIALFQQGNAADASQKLEKAYQLLPVPSVALWSGRALEQRGLLVEASERYLEASRLRGAQGDKAVQLQAQKDAAREREKLLPRIPSLVISVPNGSGTPSVMLDGKLVPPALLGEEQPANPGQHEIELVLAERRAIRRITLKESEKKTETIGWPDQNDAASPAAGALSPNLTPTPRVPLTRDSGALRPESHHRTLAYIALAAGGAGVVLGTVTGALAMSKHSSLEDSGGCKDDVCGPDERSEVESLDRLRTISTAGFIGGGVLAAAGVVLLVTEKQERTATRNLPRFALRVSPSGLSLAGAFR